MRYIFIILLLGTLFACAKDNTIAPPVTEPEPVITALQVENVQIKLSTPRRVQYLFSLRDQDDHAVVIPAAVLKQRLRPTIYHNNIVQTEVVPVLHPAADFALDLVLALDFTSSMVSANALEEMVEGAISIIATLSNQHRIAIIEFHDSNPSNNFSVIQPLTFDKQTATKALQHFADQGTYHGFTQCWNAVQAGLELFDTEQDPQKVKAMLIISDGANVNSTTQPDQIVTQAQEGGIRLYAIGMGNIEQQDEEVVQAMANSTGGQFYVSDSATYMQQRFNSVIADLGGNYSLLYVAPSAVVTTSKVSFNYKEIISDPGIEQEIDLTPYGGDDYIGLVETTDPVVTGDTIEFDLNAGHIPRGVSQFRIGIGIETPDSVYFDLNNTLLENWSEPEYNGRWFVSYGSALGFGDSGTLAKVVIKRDPAVADSLVNVVIPVLVDNTIYDYGVYFYNPSQGELVQHGTDDYWFNLLPIGLMTGNPQPYNRSRLDFSNLADSRVALSWELFDRPTYYYDVLVDSLDTTNPIDAPTTAVATGITQTSWTYPLNPPAENGSTYLWQIKFYAGSYIDYSPVWRFTVVPQFSE